MNHGSSQNNAIDFITAISGVTRTVIRDAFYETKRFRKHYNQSLLGNYEWDKLDKYLKENNEVIISISKNRKFRKSAQALEKLKARILQVSQNREKALMEATKQIELMRQKQTA